MKNVFLCNPNRIDKKGTTIDINNKGKAIRTIPSVQITHALRVFEENINIFSKLKWFFIKNIM